MDAAGGAEARGGSKCGRPGAGAAPDAYAMCGCTVVGQLGVGTGKDGRGMFVQAVEAYT